MLDDVTPTALAGMLSYDAETGALFWKPRPLEHFAFERAWKMWNTRYAGQPAFTSRNSEGYLTGKVFDRTYKAHRVAWAVVHLSWPQGEVDHIDGDRTNNALVNLRDVDGATNRRSRAKSRRNSSGANGVWQCGRKWRAVVGKLHLGVFETREEADAARRAYDRKAGFSDRHGL